ncbi:MAG: hypothetical protein JJU48_05505 [Methylophaga sp.]|nr:hypothetical protein [Methylophaga sp.]
MQQSKRGIYVRLSKQVITMLKQEADDCGVTITELVRTAVIEKIERDYGITLRN